MFLLLLLYSVIYFCRTGEYVPFIGQVHFLATIRHEALVALLLFGVIILSTEGRRNLGEAFQNGAWKAHVVFLGLTFLSIPFAAWPGNAFSWFVDFFKLFLFCVMIVACIRDENEFNKYILVYIVCMIYIAYGPVQNYLAGTFMYDYATNTHRIASPINFYKNPNVLAATLLQCVPFIYYRIVHTGLFQKKLVNGIWIAVIAMMLFVIIITGSRGGFLVLAGLAFIICYRSSYRKAALVCGLVLAVIGWFVMGEEYQQRYMTITEMGESDKPAMDRILGLKHGFQMMLSRPVLGVGIGCYHHARWNMFEYPLWAHSLPGQLMGELGLLGTVTFVVFIFQFFKNTRQTRRNLAENGMQSSMLAYHALALEASMFAQIVNGIGQHSLYLFGFYVMSALSVVLLRITKYKVKALTIEDEK